MLLSPYPLMRMMRLLTGQDWQFRRGKTSASEPMPGSKLLHFENGGEYVGTLQCCHAEPKII